MFKSEKNFPPRLAGSPCVTAGGW